MTPAGALLAEEIRRSTNHEVTTDLRSNCPICGNPYQDGDRVLALAAISFALNALPFSPEAGDSDPSSKIILGHQGCVLPRLLTLLASFQPEGRFVKASKVLTAGECVFSERHHDKR